MIPRLLEDVCAFTDSRSNILAAVGAQLGHRLGWNGNLGYAQRAVRKQFCPGRRGGSLRGTASQGAQQERTDSEDAARFEEPESGIHGLNKIMSAGPMASP